MREVALVSPRSVAGTSRRERPSVTPRYWAFLSYSHKDSETADWLHGALEKFAVPRSLVGNDSPHGPIPARFSPIFRDRQELAAASDLGHTIREALAASRCLIVLCSPDAARSRWTNEEIIAFKKAHPSGCVLAAIVDGEPFASELPGHEGEECFPPALRQKFDSRGRPTGKRAEPIAADLRPTGDGRQLGLLKIIAGMLGVGLDDLVQREQQRRHKRLTTIAAASLTGMVLTSGLAVFAFEKRDEARDQRREAEGLVGFMLGDLRQKLEPIGRLDALDAVGSRALAYFAKQDKSELSDAALAQRSKALTMMGEIAQTRGDLEGARARYAEAMSGTAEMVRRSPDDPERLFEHAQNVFWIGEIARERGQLDQAEAAAREYKNLSYRMTSIDPASVRYRMETQYSDAELGIVYLAKRRFPEASRQFKAAVATIERVAAAEPNNREYQLNFSKSLAWLADAQWSEGKLDEAIAQREREVDLLTRLSKRGRDVEYLEQMIIAHQALGRLFASRGESKEALEHLNAAVSVAENLIPSEPDNMRWVEYAASSKLALANTLLAYGSKEEAGVQARAGCDMVSRLLARSTQVTYWQEVNRDCLAVRAELALAANATDEAASLAGQLLRSTQAVGKGPSLDDRYKLAAAQRLVGDVADRQGDRARALQAWQAGLATLPKNVTERPRELGERVELLKRVGRNAEARAIEARLAAMGFRRSI
ncbi:toll/interleukin-1 receptor domain-containing protein [Sphingomonas alba]|uniref:TIR domain-containing protein n=1 Tax=Sphingomonas alba TaxID=2908208 RepID=A0ABT0RMR0_9SPHN|nr:toll/interleukin-1 receptor domain-containing protein [Sphingomonas alba]MCL6683927.1 TIR domain-containing protein [Sphingomonas alba]